MSWSWLVFAEQFRPENLVAALFLGALGMGFDWAWRKLNEQGPIPGGFRVTVARFGAVVLLAFIFISAVKFATSSNSACNFERSSIAFGTAGTVEKPEDFGGQAGVSISINLRNTGERPCAIEDVRAFVKLNDGATFEGQLIPFVDLEPRDPGNPERLRIRSTRGPTSPLNSGAITNIAVAAAFPIEPAQVRSIGTIFSATFRDTYGRTYKLDLPITGAARFY